MYGKQIVAPQTNQFSEVNMFTWRAHDELCGFTNDPQFVRCFTGVVSRVLCPHISYVESAIFCLLASSLRQRRYRSRPLDSRPRHSRGAALDGRILSDYKVRNASG